MKLHEALAIESSLQNQANKVVKETSETFLKKRHLFEKKVVLFNSSEENTNSVVESQSDINSTIVKELKWILPYISKHINAEFAISKANTVAKADIIVENPVTGGSTVIAKDVPGTVLLELEKRLNELHVFLSTIPTLDPAKGFTYDDSSKTYKARDVSKTRTRKVKEVLVKYPATDKHPAQVDVVDVDKPIGVVLEQEWSGLITPADKSDLLTKVELLQRSVKSARSRANNEEVPVDANIAGPLLDFIFTDLLKK